MEKSSYILTDEMSYEEWKNERRKGIGGSDVAAVLGLSKYRTPLDVYNEKRGLVSEKAITAPMKAGIMLEDTIAQWYMLETNKKVIRDNKIRIHPEYPYLYANLDRIILPENGEGRGILEIKTSNYFAAKYWEDEPPTEYVLQIQHYLDITGYKWGEFAVLVGGSDFRRYYIERDDELIHLKNLRIKDFWENHVMAGRPPEPINEEDINKLYERTVEGKTVEAVPALIREIDRLRDVKAQIKTLEEEEETLQESVKLVLKDADTLLYKGEVLATWKQAKDSQKFDEKLFKAEHKDLYEKYLNTKPGSRRFLLK